MRRIVFLFIFFCFSSLVLRAQFSPGDLSSAHETLEGMSNCTKCHELGKEVSQDLCMACHGEIEKRLTEKSGYHAFAVFDEKKACVDCHSEHHGKKFALVYWEEGIEKFDHSQTGYTLEGKHRDVRCETCHQPVYIVEDLKTQHEGINLEKTLLGLDQTCLSCHLDEHRGQVRDECLACHRMSGWKPASDFSHNNTVFPLTGKHQDVECLKCHPSQADEQVAKDGTGDTHFLKFAGLSYRNCVPCHQDVHDGSLGNDCASCHNTGGWKTMELTGFDHGQTDFPLVGRHIGLTCETCHTSGAMTQAIPHEQCRSCHEDIHQGQFADREDGGRCEACHTEERFTPAFFSIEDHRKTRYPLTGSHFAVTCDDCHKKEVAGKSFLQFDFTDLRCQGCHEDVHKGQFDRFIRSGGCESCHMTDTWETTSFEHDKTRFPLIGKHRAVDCRDCHKTIEMGTENERIQFVNTPLDCASCHTDIHNKQFAVAGQVACQRCHEANGWKTLKFVHNRDSRFVLEGAHEKAACQECHQPIRENGITFIRYRPIDITCKNCHGDEPLDKGP